MEDSLSKDKAIQLIPDGALRTLLGSDSGRAPVKTGDANRGAIEDKLNRFISELKLIYPQFAFKKSHRFKFRPPKTIYIAYGDNNFALLTLHELGHALSKHKDYKTCAERLKIEREAWERARAVLKNHPEWTKKYDLTYDEDFVEAQLDTYRDWLHQKSTCKTCGLTRFQTPDGLYHCPRCETLLKTT